MSALRLRRKQAGRKSSGLLISIAEELRHPIIRWAYIFLLPGAIWLFLLHFYPIARGIYYSLHTWSGNINQSPVFAGLSNYAGALKDGSFWKAVRHTFYYILLTVPINTFFSMLIAVLLSQTAFLRSFFRSLFFVPSIVGVVIASIIWRWCYDPMFGVFNYFLSVLGLPRVFWLTGVKMALPSIAIMTVWQNMGYYVVIFLAGLAAIPQTLYEASHVDGASKMYQFFRITFPLLGPVTIFVFMYSTIKNLKIFGEIFVMTGGGPARATETIGFMIYEQAFTYNNYGSSMAMSILMFFMILLVTIVQFSFLENKTRVEY